MAVRREKVIVELEDRFTREMAKMAAAASLFDKELGHVSTSSGPGFTRTSMTIERDSGRAGNSIDKLSGRLAILAQSAAALGPALVPITTTAVPAIAGLTTQLGFAVAGVGTAVLAFNGFSDALDAMNKAALHPTEENLQKAEEAMRKISPAAREMVVELREMAPAFRAVRDEASENLFPGLLRSLDDVDTLLPRVGDIVGEVAETLGNLAEAGAASLAGDEWAEFFNFIEREARPTLTNLGETIGNLTHGLAEMWMAFDPLSDDFQSGLLDASQAFDDWASSLAQTEDFAEFVAYIRETGPQVLDTIGSMAGAFLQVVEAAAPLGGPVLHILETVADVIGTIADSPLGTPLVGLASAMSALSLVTRGYERVAETSFGAGASARAKALATSITTVTSATDRARLSTEQLARVEQQRGATTRAGIAKSAAVLGGLALAGTGASESIGLANTTSLALMGTIAGPWGAAIGGGIGLLMDMTASTEDVEASTQRLSDLMSNGAGFHELESALRDAQEELDAYRVKVQDPGIRGLGQTDLRGFEAIASGWRGLKNEVEGLFGKSDIEEATEPLRELEDQLFETQRTATELALRLGADITTTGGTSLLTVMASGFGFDESDFATTTAGVNDLEAALRSAGPAMAALGYTLEEINAMEPDERKHVLARIAAWIHDADSESGRMTTIREAIAGLGNELDTTADKADALTDALDALLNPKIDVSEARDDWHEALRTLSDDLDHIVNPAIAAKEALIDSLQAQEAAAKSPAVRDALRAQIKAAQDQLEALREAGEIAGSREVFGDNEGAAANRDALRDRVKLIQELISAETAAGASPERIAQIFKNQREALLDTATAAGLAREDVKKFLHQLGLTPKLVRVAIEAAGLDAATAGVDRLNAKLIAITRRVWKIQAQAVISGDRFGVSTTGGRDGDPNTPFATGGYTGNRGILEPAGIVHGQEFVFDAKKTAKYRSLFETIHRMPGYDTGGYVTPVQQYAQPVMSAMSAAGLGIDMDRLVALVAQHTRPLYGDQYVQPHNYSEFKREQQRDMHMAGMGGARTA